jgi:transcriptional regulator with XRE-family HTH domain
MIGERIKQWRERYGWSQNELARRANVPQALISRLESGQRDTVTTDVAKRLARALGVGIDYLVGTWDTAEEAAMAPPVPTAGPSR